MINQEKITVEMQNYLIINGRVILSNVDLPHPVILGEDQIISSGGLACIWKKGNVKQVVYCIDSDSLAVSSNKKIDQQLIAEHLGIGVAIFE